MSCQATCIESHHRLIGIKPETAAGSSLTAHTFLSAPNSHIIIAGCSEGLQVMIARIDRNLQAF